MPLEFRISLRILDAGSRHDEIERILGMPPTAKHLKGDPARDHHVHGKFETFPADVWLLEAPGGRVSRSRRSLEQTPADAAPAKASPFQDQMRWLGDLIREHSAFFASLRSAGARLNICGSANLVDPAGDFMLDPDLVAILGQAGFSINFLIIKARA